MIQILQNQVNSFQQNELETKFGSLSDDLLREHRDFSENQNPEKRINLNMLSEASLSTEKASSTSQQYNLSSRQDKAQNGPNFITLGKIFEEEKRELIETGLKVYF